jgi:hypothetical protein
MNIALADIFLKCLSLQVHASFQQQRLYEPNIVFINIFLWFVSHYRKITSKDCKANCQWMAADWHPSDGIDHLVLRLFTGAAFVSSAAYSMNDIDVINIGLQVIKLSGMYMGEYKQWIACKAIHPQINENMASFKEFLSSKIALVNQTTIPTSLHGNGMAAVSNKNGFVSSYGKSIANFGAAYAATQESVKMQGSTIALLQGQVNLMQQYCMVLQQQPCPTIYAQQQRAPSNRSAVHCTATVPAGGDINNRTINSLPPAYLRCAHQRPSNASKTGIVAVPMGATLTTLT